MLSARTSEALMANGAIPSVAGRIMRHFYL